ncbi:MAG: beta-ketoacyl-ACP synthase III [Rickettsiales bacterium]
MKRGVVLSTGSYLPERIMPNSELEAMVETSDEWITARTGIKQRHIAAEGEFTSDLAVKASKEAIKKAGIEADSIDLILVATATPDETMPSTAATVQHKLGITKGAAFDLNAVCSGFVYALATANGFIATGQAKRILVIGAETFSRLLNWEDRGTCILFGDGAGAIILDAQEQAGTSADKGLLYANIFSDGQYGELLNTTGGISSTQTAGKLTMAGKEVFRHAVAKMPEALTSAMNALSLPLDSIDWLVPHQANQRILKSVGEKLGIDGKKVITTVDQHANTSAASIPLALDVACKDGRIKAGDLVACPAMGAGFTWGSAIIRW